MELFETKILQLHNETPSQEIQDKLNELGKKGFHLIHVTEAFKDNGGSWKDYYNYILERNVYE